jgi:putative peptidoglycan lipid II flippase
MSVTKPSSLLRGTAIVASLTLLSRALGFLREVLVARLFGASLIADTYFVGLRIPNMLRSIFAEGALTSAFIPVFADRLKEGDTVAHDSFRSIATALIIVTSAVTILGIWYAEAVVSLVAPGFTADPTQFALAVKLTQIMFPYIICVSLITLFNGALNSVQIFGISAWAQVTMNIVLIIGAYVAAYFQMIEAAYVLSYSVVIGGIIQVITQMPALKRAGFPLFFLGNPFSKSTTSVCLLMLPAILGAQLYQLTIFISTQLASSLEAGAVAWLSYADRLVQLPVGVITIALSTVLLPTLSRTAAQQNHSEFNKALIDSLRFTAFLMIPTTAGMLLFSPFLVSLFLERGAFDAYAAAGTASVARAYAIGLVPVSLHALLIRALQAKKDTLTPTLIGLATLVATLLFCLVLPGPLPRYEASQLSVAALQGMLFQALSFIDVSFIVTSVTAFQLGAVGLALGSSIAMFITACISGYIVAKRNPLLSWAPLWRSISKSTLSAGLAACIASPQVAHYFIPSDNIFIFESARIVLFTFGCCLCSRVLGTAEFLETFQKVKRFLPYDQRNRSNPNTPTN